MRNRLIAFFVSVAVATSLAPLTSANSATKPTTTCKKVGQTLVLNSYKFTCIKSGKKIVWNAGVRTSNPKPLPKPTESASPAPTPTPTPSQSALPTSNNNQGQTIDSNLPQEGSNCTNFAEKIPNSAGYIKCDWQGGYSFAWRKYIVPKLNTSTSNNYSTTPIESAKCNQSGDTFNISTGYLECRYVKGSTLQWVKINSSKNSFVNTLSPNGTEPCKLQNSAVPPKSGRDSGQTAGFPTVPRDSFINPGINQAIVIGVDFPELRGKDSDLAATNEYDRKMLYEWYAYFSNGKVAFNLASYDHWIHSPNSAKSYSISGTFDSTADDGPAVIGKLSQKFVDLITKEVDLSAYKTIFLIYPNGEFTLDSDMIVRNYPFTIKEGIRNMNLFGWGKDMELMASLHWPFYIHESLHDAVLIGHAPGNGWPFSVMTNQSGISLSPFSWEQFQLEWLPDNQIYCANKETLKNVKISLSPMEREDKQTKSAIIRVSATKAIVIESHAIDKWSDFKTNDRAFPAGFYGVMAYLVDLEKAAAPPVAPDGRTLQDDSGNDPNYPRWAYWQPVDGGGSSQINWNYRTTSLNYNDYVALLGDSITVEGIKIAFVGTGDYEIIEISKT